MRPITEKEQKDLSLMFKHVSEQILYRTDDILQNYINILDIRNIILGYTSALIYHLDLSEIQKTDSAFDVRLKIYLKDAKTDTYSIQYLDPFQLGEFLQVCPANTLISTDLGILRSKYLQRQKFEKFVIYVKGSIDRLWPPSLWFINWAKILKNKSNCLVVLDSKTSLRSLQKLVDEINYDGDLWLPPNLIADPTQMNDLKSRAGKNLYHFRKQHFSNPLLSKYEAGWVHQNLLLKIIIVFSLASHALILFGKPEKLGITQLITLGITLIVARYYLNQAGAEALKEEKSAIKKFLEFKGSSDECCSIQSAGARFFNPWDEKVPTKQKNQELHSQVDIKQTVRHRITAQLRRPTPEGAMTTSSSPYDGRVGMRN